MDTQPCGPTRDGIERVERRCIARELRKEYCRLMVFTLPSVVSSAAHGR
jgi:hypothetical protein